MTQKNPTSFSDRLSDEVHAWAARNAEARLGREGSAMTFHRAISERLDGERAGTSYRAVLTYLNGAITPSLVWVREAATLLGVQVGWLAADQGPRTLEEQVGAAVADARRQPDDTDANPSPEQLERAFLEGLPALKRASPTSWHAVADLWATYTYGSRIFADVARSHVEGPDAGKHGAADIMLPKLREASAEAGRQVAEMVAAGADKTGIDLQDLSPWEIDRYIQITAQALQVLFRPHTLPTTRRDDKPKED